MYGCAFGYYIANPGIQISGRNVFMVGMYELCRILETLSNLALQTIGSQGWDYKNEGKIPSV